MIKNKLLILAAILLISLFAVYLINMRFNKTGDSNTPSSELPTDNVTTQTTGFITGKLCYPSQFLPSGIIVAKDISTTDLYQQEYLGSEQGGASTYTLEVPEGTYNLRYEAEIYQDIDTTLNGYHTVQCPTGREVTCSQDNERTLKTVTVTAGNTEDNVDLCDFYYTEDGEPEF